MLYTLCVVRSRTVTRNQIYNLIYIHCVEMIVYICTPGALSADSVTSFECCAL